MLRFYKSRAERVEYGCRAFLLHPEVIEYLRHFYCRTISTREIGEYLEEIRTQVEREYEGSLEPTQEELRELEGAEYGDLLNGIEKEGA
jgi:hypothetical protein